jgi:hypothetical protein
MRTLHCRSERVRSCVPESRGAAVVETVISCSSKIHLNSHYPRNTPRRSISEVTLLRSSQVSSVMRIYRQLCGTASAER